MFQGFSFKYLISIIIGFVILFFSPALYLGLTCGGGWWPLFASIVVGVVQVMAASAIAGLLSNDMMTLKEQHSPLAGGLLCGLSICGFLFWLLFPSIVGYTHLFENTFYYYGFHRDSESPSIISIAFFLIACMVYIMFISGSLEVAGLKIDKGVKSISNSPSFVKGVAFSLSFFFFVGVIFYLIPVGTRLSYNAQIKQLNERIDSINNNRLRIKDTRLKEYRVLSFADFKLGSSLDSCSLVINSSYEYALLQKDKVPYKYELDDIKIMGIDYSSIYDSLQYVSYEWDNEHIYIGLYFRKNRLLAIQFKTNHASDSIVSLYTHKYGESESLMPRKEELDNSYAYYVYDRVYMQNMEVEEYVAAENIWTYINALIYIRQLNYEYCSVIYFDRQCEGILTDIETRKEMERRNFEKRRNDSIQRQQEYEQRLRDSEERIRERKHKESIEKI